MATFLSPGVNVSEVDLTTIVPAVSTSVGAFSGLFRWGPIGERVLLDSESNLVKRFATPTNYNAETWFTAANFLSYTNALYISRAAQTSGAIASLTANTVANTLVTNNVFTVTSGNTLSISNGNYYVYQTTNSAVVTATGPSITATVINSTAFSLTTNATVNTVATMYFGRSDATYTSVGVEPNTIVSNLVNQIVLNENLYTTKDGNFQSGVTWIAKYPGAIGNSIKVSVVDTANQFSSNIGLSNNSITGTIYANTGSNTATVILVGDTTGSFSTSVVNQLTVGDQILFGNSSINLQYIKITGIVQNTPNSTASSITLNFQTPYRLATNTAFTGNSTVGINRYWEYFGAARVAPGQSNFVRYNGNTSANDELHVVVVDEDGQFTGTPGTILESFIGLSRATDAKGQNGQSIYYKNVINQDSAYIWWSADRPLAISANALVIASSSQQSVGNYSLSLGADGYDEATVSLATVASGYDLFRSKEDVDISIVLQGRPIQGSTSSTVGGASPVNFLLANYIIDNLVSIRRDCVACISPDKTMTLNAFGQEAINLVSWRNALHDSSYTVLDSGYKYQYDRYNDLYRWIPMNGDVGGLMARTDHTNDAWWSPAGFNRGQINNLVKLAYNPRQTDRDLLYTNGINPVVTFPGQGTVLYGDKTLQAKPSAFDRINVRRLFIVLEKAISQAAKYSLFEFNDSFTRSQFKNLVVPYLRTIQGRRGITDFLVVCDETNNTPQIIDSNQFVGDIYIKPARSINFIQLNFVAVGTGVQFSEVVGKF